MPDMATRTVNPEMRTERPDVALQLRAKPLRLARGSLFALSLQIEQAVVDADGRPIRRMTRSPSRTSAARC
jgi:hypothetical protein